MQPLIKLTHLPTEKDLYINVNHIVLIYSDESNKTKIYLVTDLLYEVKESVEQIIKHLSILRLEQ